MRSMQAFYGLTGEGLMFTVGIIRVTEDCVDKTVVVIYYGPGSNSQALARFQLCQASFQFELVFFLM